MNMCGDVLTIRLEEQGATAQTMTLVNSMIEYGNGVAIAAMVGSRTTVCRQTEQLFSWTPLTIRESEAWWTAVTSFEVTEADRSLELSDSAERMAAYRRIVDGHGLHKCGYAM